MPSEYETAILQYALQNEKLDDSFFLDLAVAEKQNILTVERHIEFRNDLSNRILAAISEEREDVQHRLVMTSPNYVSRLAALSRRLDGLNKEARNEEIRRWKDTTALAEKLLDRKKEYRAISSLFRSVAIETPRNAGVMPNV